MLKKWAGVALLVIWLSATFAGYGWYQQKMTRPYQGSPNTHARLPENLVRDRFNALMMEQSVHSGPVLVHFSRAQCRCQKDSRAHLNKLIRQFPDTRVIHMPAPDDERSDPGTLAAQQLWAIVPATPSAAVLDRRGRLVYFGPYSSGPVCGSGIEFVGQILQALQQEQAPELWVNDLAFGCFCANGSYKATRQLQGKIQNVKAGKDV